VMKFRSWRLSCAAPLQCRWAPWVLVRSASRIKCACDQLPLPIYIYNIYIYYIYTYIYIHYIYNIYIYIRFSISWSTSMYPCDFFQAADRMQEVFNLGKLGPAGCSPQWDVPHGIWWWYGKIWWGSNGIKRDTNGILMSWPWWETVGFFYGNHGYLIFIIKQFIGISWKITMVRIWSGQPCVISSMAGRSPTTWEGSMGKSSTLW
jgi:hypothetical protein